MPDLVTPATEESASDRILTARLGYSFAKRRGRRLPTVSDGEADLAWFEYQLGGLGLGIVEGVLLGNGTDIDRGRLAQAIEHSGANLIKLTRVVPGPVVDTLPSRQIRGPWIVVRSRSPAHEILRLASTDEATLATFGRHTRRNIRAARKHAARSGFSFEVSTDTPLSAADRASLARRTKPLGLRNAETARLEAYADANGRPFRSIVRDSDGAVVSYCCGYLGTADAAYLLYQLNDSAYHAIGPSLLHRALLLPWLIEQGCAELVFVHGCIGVLAHACVPQQLEEVWLMRRSAWAHACAALIRLVKPGAPIGRLANLALSAGAPI